MITIVSPAIEGHTSSGIAFGSTSGMVVRDLPGIVQLACAVDYDVYEFEDYEAKATFRAHNSSWESGLIDRKADE